MIARRLNRLASSTLAGALFVGIAAFAAAPPRALADDDRSKCQHRIEKAEARLSDAVRDHGPRSSQAEQRRHELNEERERCYQANHAWYYGQDRQWHNDRDWDRYDHDRDDHDHDH